MSAFGMSMPILGGGTGSFSILHVVHLSDAQLGQVVAKKRFLDFGGDDGLDFDRVCTLKDGNDMPDFDRVCILKDILNTETKKKL